MNRQMNIQITKTSPTEIEYPIVIGIHEDKEFEGAVSLVNDASGGEIKKLLDLGEISTDECSTTILYSLPGIKSPLVLVIGLGSCKGDTNGLSFRASASAAKALASKQRNEVAFYLDIDEMEQAVCGSLVGCVGQDLFRSEKSIHAFENVYFYGATGQEVLRGQVLGECMNLTRRTVNLPANEIYPESFANECQQVANETEIEIEIWDEKKLTDERCGAFLAVGQGSEKPPRLVIMKYNGAGSEQAPIALVGKGVTFDSGGLSLKPSAGMFDMKCDMTGAATVLGTIAAIAKLKLPVNVIGLMGLAENMVSGNSYKLGDVLRSRNGKTIEVHNTDAEGRLVLADTLNVAVEMQPIRIIDLATLTGACVVALGTDISGVMTNDQEFCDSLLDACRSTGELAWQLPMHDHFASQIKSKVADIKNVGDGRWGGAITAGKFLEEFVDDTPWVHIDIAGPSFHDKPKPWVDAGASGCMVRALVNFVEHTF